MAATRRLAAILAADVAGYSRLMGADEEGTLERLRAIRSELTDPQIATHRGRIVKTTGARRASTDRARSSGMAGADGPDRL
jgi:class 3 adenylate cyclase